MNEWKTTNYFLLPKLTNKTKNVPFLKDLLTETQSFEVAVAAAAAIAVFEKNPKKKLATTKKKGKKKGWPFFRRAAFRRSLCFYGALRVFDCAPCSPKYFEA